MATATLRPNGEISRHTDWVITDGGATTADQVLDDAVTQPTAPGTGSDYVSHIQLGTTNVEVALETVTVGTVMSAKVWYYAALSGVSPSLTTKLFKGATEIATVTITSGAAAWYSVTYTGNLTQAEVDDLRIRFGAANTASTCTVYAAYVELTYSPIKFVRDGGTLADKAPVGGANSVTVPAAGHAVGNLVVLGVGWPGTVTVSSVADTRTNTWTLIEPGQGGNRVYASVLTTALVSGDTITVTFSAAPAEVVLISKEFSSVTTTEDVASAEASFASNANPTVGPITPVSAETLVIGWISVGTTTAETFTEDADTAGGAGWTGLLVGTSGGGAASNIKGNLAHKITSSAASQTYNPTLSAARECWLCLASLQKAAAATPKSFPSVPGARRRRHLINR